jgi:cephalosporin hydroxylase
MLTAEEYEVVIAFDDLCNKKKLWQKLTWRGHDVAKTTEDMWLYQEVICALKPGLIVEFGTNLGGTALFYADMLDLCSDNHEANVISVDILAREHLPKHRRLSYLVGHSRHDEIIEQVREAARFATGPVLIIEDSEHTGHHVGGELEAYHDLVTPGSWFVIEDLNWPSRPNSTQEAVAEFLRTHRNFVVDESKDKYLLSVAPNGWLKRIE